MNGKIEMGAAVLVGVWAVVAAFNDQFILALVLAVAGAGLFAYGATHAKRVK